MPPTRRVSFDQDIEEKRCAVKTDIFVIQKKLGYQAKILAKNSLMQTTLRSMSYLCDHNLLSGATHALGLFLIVNTRTTTKDLKDRDTLISVDLIPGRNYDSFFVMLLTPDCWSFSPILVLQVLLDGPLLDEKSKAVLTNVESIDVLELTRQGREVPGWNDVVAGTKCQILDSFDLGR